MTKILYFEGAGCVPRGEVENCRIRTAFHHYNGRGIYLEIMGNDVPRDKRGIRPAWAVSCKDYAGIVTDCFFIDDQRYFNTNVTFEYTKENILSFVNGLGGSFDEVVILPNLAGYRVHRENRGYNFGDEFTFDRVLTRRREQIEKYYYALEKSEGKQYPNFSLWVDEENPAMLHLLRSFNGYNRHWLIDATADDWQATATQTPLHSPGEHGIAE